MNIKTIATKELGIISLTFLILVAVFYFAPFEAGRDWRVINGGLQRFISGDVVYKITVVDDLDYGFYQAPWVVLVLSPLAFLPVKLSYAIICSLSILGILALGKRYNLGTLQLILFFASPPVLYNIWQGHIDIILLACVFLPLEFWPLLSIAKPQLLGGLTFGLLTLKKDTREAKNDETWKAQLLQQSKLWLRTALVSGSIILISFAIFGLWPLEIINMTNQEFSGLVLHNVFKLLWPMQLIVAVAIILVGFERRDERYFIAASPFLSRYATIGNFVGLTLVTITAMKWWQALAFVLTWWVVLIIA